MSRNRSNNHYHYAEQYTDGSYRRKANRASKLYLPKRFVFFALLLILTFAIITATFSVYTPASEPSGSGSLIVKVRNAKVAKDLEVGGLNKEDAIALASTGANADLAAVGTSVGSTNYYYRGGTHGWDTWAAMTKDSSGYFSYVYMASGSTFKISTSNANNYNNVLDNIVKNSDGFWGNTSFLGVWDTGTDWSSSASSLCRKDGDSNTKPYHSVNVDTFDNLYVGTNTYICVYYPNTELNGTSTALIVPLKTLPTAPYYQVNYGYAANDWRQGIMTTSSNPVTESSTWSTNITLSGNGSYEFEIQKVFNTSYPNRGTLSYGDENKGTMTYSSNGPWTLYNSHSGDHPWVNTVISGAYTFTLHSTAWYDKSVNLSISYPTYTVTTSKSPTAGSASSPTPASSTVAIGNSVTVSAPNPATGYEFVNWTVTSGSVKTGSYTGTNMTTSTTQTNLTVYPYGTSSSVNLQANYKLKEYTITYDRGNVGGVSSVTGTVTAGTKQYGIDYTIASTKFTRSGYTQVGWATTANYTRTSSNGGTIFYKCDGTSIYTGNENLTLYPVWQLNAPTNGAGTAAPQISGGSIIDGGTYDFASASNYVSPCPANAVRTYSYTIKRLVDSVNETYEDASLYVTIGTDPTDALTLHTFTTTTPGTYKLTWTVTDTAQTGVVNANSIASAISNEVTILVQPSAPTSTLTVVNIVQMDSNDPNYSSYGTSNLPYKILLGNRYYFTAKVDSAFVNNHPYYTYTWSKSSDFSASNIIGTGSLINFDFNPTDSTYTVIDLNATPDQRRLASEPIESTAVTIYCRAECNGQTNMGSEMTKSYFIQPLIESFNYMPHQKIYNSFNGNVTLEAQYNLEDANGFTTYLRFSDDNNTYVDAIYNNDTPGIANQFIASFADVIRRFLHPAGPKYFYMQINGTNESNEPFQSPSSKIHTTVSTSDFVATRPLFFYNHVLDSNSHLVSLADYLVMCYYIDGSGNLGYQVAQDMYRGNADYAGKYYRVNVPVNVTSVYFGFVDKDEKGVRYYGMPTVTNGAITGFSAPIFKGHTQEATLESNTRVISASATNFDTTAATWVFPCTAEAYSTAN